MNEKRLVKLTYTSQKTQKTSNTVITYGWFLNPEHNPHQIEVSDSSKIIIFLENKQLNIVCQQSDLSDEDINVDITILEQLPIRGLYIHTGGICKIDTPLELQEGIYLHAKSISIQQKLKINKDICLVTPLTNDNEVIIAQTIQARSLNVSTKNLHLNAQVMVDVANLYDCNLIISDAGKLKIKGNNAESNLFLKILESSGVFEANNTQVKTDSSAVFQDGSRTSLKKCQLFLNSLDVKKLAKIDGKSDYFQITAKAKIDGVVSINHLIILSHDATVNGLVWGGEHLQVQISFELGVAGVLAGKKTSVHAIYMYASGENDYNFDFFSPYIKGSVNGEVSLNINTVVTVMYGGGSLQGSNIQQNTGISVNILGMVAAFDYINLALIDIPYGLDLPYKPAEYSDLLSIDKLFRLSLRFASNYFIKLKSLLSLLSFVRPFAMHTLHATSAILVAAYNDIRNENFNGDNELLTLLNNANEAIANNLGVAYGSLSGLTDPNTIRTMISQTSMLDVVNGLLRAKGYYMLGNSIYQVGTNVRAFTSDATTTLMQSPREISAELKNAAMGIRNMPTHIKHIGARIIEMRNSMLDPAVIPAESLTSQVSASMVAPIPQVSPPQSAVIPQPSQPTSGSQRMQMGKGKKRSKSVSIHIGSKSDPEQTMGLHYNPGNLGIEAYKLNFDNPLKNTFRVDAPKFNPMGDMDIHSLKFGNPQSLPPLNMQQPLVKQITAEEVVRYTTQQSANNQPGPIKVSDIAPVTETRSEIIKTLGTTPDIGSVDLPISQPTDQLGSHHSLNPVQDSGLIEGVMRYFANHQDVQVKTGEEIPIEESNRSNRSGESETHISASNVKYTEVYQYGVKGFTHTSTKITAKLPISSSRSMELARDELRKVKVSIHDWYEPVWIDNSSDVAMQFSKGVAAGILVNGAIFKASSIKYLGTFIRGASLLGAGVMVAEAFGVAAEFERDNFMYTEEYEDIIGNPLISEERKTQLLDESLRRQNGARKEAEQLKNLATKFRENPMIFGFGVGSFLSIDHLPGSSFAANAFMNLRIRNPLKSVSNDRHLEYLNKVVKAPMGVEHIEIAAGGAHGFENFAKARTMAAIRANLGEDAVPYLSSRGPYEGNVYVGMGTSDNSCLWRLDLNTRVPSGTPPTPHINWRYYDDKSGKLYVGAINIDMTLDEYYQIVNRFPRKLPFIGG